MPRRTWAVLATVALGTGTAVALATGTASAVGTAPSTGTTIAVGTSQSGPQSLTVAALSTADQARMVQQQPLVRAATLIRDEVEKRHYDGYTGMELKDTRVVLWWKGTVPRKIRDLVAQARKIAPVRVSGATYSLDQMHAAAAKLPATGVQGIELTVDGSGLTVDRSSGQTRATAQSRVALPHVGMPVTATTQGPLQLTSRDDDWSPWKSGATIFNATRKTACTAGFGVHNGGAGYLLTAAHCGQPGDKFTDPHGEFIGYVGSRNVDHDIEMIPTSVDGYTYVGDENSNSVGFVEGWGWTFVGQYLCQSGTSSAAETGHPVCNLKVTSFDTDKGDMVKAQQMDGLTPARPGDSGGPVYAVDGSNGKLIAEGVTDGMIAGTSTLYFQDFGTVWRDFHVIPTTR